jgi:hypothetical protein
MRFGTEGLRAGWTSRMMLDLREEAGDHPSADALGATGRANGTVGRPSVRGA